MLSVVRMMIASKLWFEGGWESQDVDDFLPEPRLTFQSMTTPFIYGAPFWPFILRHLSK